MTDLTTALDCDVGVDQTTRLILAGCSEETIGAHSWSRPQTTRRFLAAGRPFHDSERGVHSVTARSTGSGDDTIVHGFLTSLELARPSTWRASLWGKYCGRTNLAVKLLTLSALSG
jgi:hypothetical protein